MATPSDERDPDVRPPGSKYPWSEWQDGRWWKISQGEDFTCMVSAMRDQLHVRAKTTGRRVKTHTDKQKTIQFVFQRADETEQQFANRSGATGPNR